LREYRSALIDNRRWGEFRSRPDDIFVCTPAKCGTTWTQTIIANMLWPAGDLPEPVMILSPWIEANFIPAEVLHPMLEAQTHRRFIKSHTPADGIPFFDDAKYVFVGRDGRDAFMSLSNHMERMKGLDELNEKARDASLPEMPKYDGDLHAFFDRWLSDDEQFFHVVSSYWERREQSNVLFVHYADLKSDLSGEMHRIADFLGIDVPASQWDDVVDRCTFESMRENGEKIGPIEMRFEGGAKGFIFKGTNGRWREELSSEEVARYEKRARECLPVEAVDWLERGRRSG
jgi:aryl sulfotransferase